MNSFKARLTKNWHGHELIFNASCYVPGETVFSNFVRCQNGSLEVARQLGTTLAMVSYVELC